MTRPPANSSPSQRAPLAAPQLCKLPEKVGSSRRLRPPKNDESASARAAPGAPPGAAGLAPSLECGGLHRARPTHDEDDDVAGRP